MDYKIFVVEENLTKGKKACDYPIHTTENQDEAIDMYKELVHSSSISIDGDGDSILRYYKLMHGDHKLYESSKQALDHVSVKAQNDMKVVIYLLANRPLVTSKV